MRLVAGQLQHQGQRFGGVGVVVGYQDPPAPFSFVLGLQARREMRLGRRLDHDGTRKNDFERAAATGSPALHVQASAVQSDERIREGKADSETALPAFVRRLRLIEHFEDARGDFGCQPDPVVADEDDQRVGLERRAQRDRAFRLRVLGCVEQQVAHDLRHAHGIDVEHEEGGRHIELERVTSLVDEGAGCFDGVLEDLLEGRR